MLQRATNLLETTQKAINVFLFSAQSNGQIAGIGHWQAANGYTAIALHDHYSRTRQYEDTVFNAIQSAAVSTDSHCKILNEFNDDSLWWALACIAAFKTYGGADGEKCLQQAEAIWTRIERSQVKSGQYSLDSRDMQGAVMWTVKEGEDNLSSITTSLFAELGAQLADIATERKPPSPSNRPRRASLADRLKQKLSQSISPDPSKTAISATEYLAASRSALCWVLRNRYNEQEGIILDGTHIDSSESVDWAFTYNTGQAIAACIAIDQATGDRKFTNSAYRMAEAALGRRQWMNANGILSEDAYSRERFDAFKNDDAVAFKSVLFRSLVKLLVHLERIDGMDQSPNFLQVRLRQLIDRNFDSLQTRNTNGRGQYGPWWEGPMDMPTSHSQLAVLDVMAGIHVLS